MRSSPAFGTRPATKVTEWRAWAREVVTASGFRRDLTATLLGVVDCLAFAWHPRRHISSPGHDVIAERIGRGPDTVTRSIARLAELGLIYTSAPGTVIWDGDVRRNLRAEYVLTVPVPKSETRSTIRDTLGSVPVGKKGRHRAAAAMQRVAGGRLSGLSAAGLASALRVWFEAGWTPAEVLDGLDRTDEGAWTYTTAPRDLRAWLAFRMSHHKDSEGQPLPSPSARTKARREATRAELAESRRGRRRGMAGLSGTARGALAAARSRVAQAKTSSRYRAAAGTVENADPFESSTLSESPKTRARRDGTLDATPGGRVDHLRERIERLRLAQGTDDDRPEAVEHVNEARTIDSPHPFLECSRKERPSPLPASLTACS